MGLFDSFMPGESSGIPTGGLLGGGWQGALEGNNPMLNIGLGILANNSGNYGSLGAALGRGAQQGIQNTQASRQAQQQAAMYKLQMAKAQKDLEEQKAMNDAIAQASQKNPEMAALFKIDPKSAIKALYPQAGGADPYTELQFDDSGQAWLNNRRETDPNKVLRQVFVDGKPFIGAKQSPSLAEDLAKGGARGKAAYDINTDTGAPLTVKQVAESLDPALQGAPQTPTSPQKQPYSIFADPNSSPEELAQLKAAAEKDYAANGSSFKSAQPQFPPKIKFPSLAEQAAEKERLAAEAKAKVELATKPKIEAAIVTAKNDAEFNSSENVKKRDQLKTFKETTAKNVVSSIDSVLGRVNSLSAGAGGNIVRALPVNSDAKDISADIETIKANFGFDRLQAMRDMSPTGGALGQVAVQELTALQASVANLDPSNQSPAQLKKNLEKAKSHYGAWLKTVEPKNAGTPPTKFSVTAPNGKQYSFGSQNELNNFKLKAGIR